MCAAYPRRSLSAVVQHRPMLIVLVVVAVAVRVTGARMLAVAAAVVAARPRLPPGRRLICRQDRRLICLLRLRPLRCAAAVVLAVAAVRHRSDHPQVGAEQVLDSPHQLRARLRQRRQGHRQSALPDLPVQSSLTRRCARQKNAWPHSLPWAVDWGGDS